MTCVDLRITGIIKKIVPDRGYGFITGDDGIDRFFHRTDLRNGHGVYFPSDRCVCGCAASQHILPTTIRARRAQCLGCRDCMQYRPAGSPLAIQEGAKVTFVHRDDDQKGPRASEIVPG